MSLKKHDNVAGSNNEYIRERAYTFESDNIIFESDFSPSKMSLNVLTKVSEENVENCLVLSY